MHVPDIQEIDHRQEPKVAYAKLKKVHEQVARAVNGRLSFGDGVRTDNMDGAWVNVVTPGVANTDFVVTHNLGRTPAGYHVVAKSAATDVYTGSVPADATTLTLRATAAGVSLRLFIL